MQRTPLEEDERSDAASIMNRVSLDVEDHAGARLG
jgi:hypothetical protein